MKGLDQMEPMVIVDTLTNNVNRTAADVRACI